MQISSRFTIAMHILTYIAYFSQEEKVTSDKLADSIRVNPVIIRNIMSQLKKAGLIEVKRGQGGASIIKDYHEISLFDVYQAVDSIKEQGLFAFHENPNPNCPVGRHIHDMLDDRLLAAQKAMEDSLAKQTLADVVEAGRPYI
ncbi:Rrf2 family transcriptional regulator [Streptococcus sp. zg-JUN1979]|uniref:Rrf2 family transcriptional regulator n=1 Tax=Streptococcus sp. zg-JUN1979 TaxID=3391450 RepID=UPI0039A40D70